mgnify:CR=1 FL=1
MNATVRGKPAREPEKHVGKPEVFEAEQALREVEERARARVVKTDSARLIREDRDRR